MKSTRTSPTRRSALASALVGALVLGTTAAGGVAFADDVDHPEPTDPGPVVVAPPTEAEITAATDWNNYEKILLSKNVGEPIDMAVLPDKRVVHTARNGDIRLTDPTTGTTSVINQIPVYANSEDGLQVIELDPNFEENNYVYVVYAPLSGTPTGNSPNSLPAGADPATYWNQWLGVNRLSRFEWTGNALDLTSEQPIIEVTVQRGQCCHVGADIDFDADGNLYLSTGDNTPASTPGANGFAPNNNAPGMNPGFDARRGAGNTNDLRGKILRINVNDEIAAGATPGAGSTYTIPAGNLFAAGTANTRPEIFVMGVRNPFRIDVDPVNNVLTWGDYGPDATAAVAATAGRGPMGLVEWNVTKLSEPINAGWPYVHGNNFAYNEWNFATNTPGAFFDPANLKNNSTWNTGLVDLPAPVPAKVWYGDNTGDAGQPFNEFTDFGSGNGQGPMGGPTYQFDAANPSTTKFPSYWHNKNFFAEFSQDYIAAITADWNTLAVQKVENFLPNGAVTSGVVPIHDNPIDIEFGPDGSLYVLEYGDGFFRANPDSGLYRIDYAEGNKSPLARFTAQPISSSSAPLTVQFNAAASVDPEGQTLTYDWDLDGDGTFEIIAGSASVSKEYTVLGQYTARLRVSDPSGKTGLTSRVVSVGNKAPDVTIASPGNGSFFQWGNHVPFQVTANDAEDGNQIVGSRVSWTYGLGHDEHAHPESSGTGATGVFRTDPNSPNHGIGAFLYGAVVVNYTDAGANGQPPATGEATLQLNPFLQEAENAIVKQGVVVFDDETASGLRGIRGLAANDFLKYSPVNFAGVTGVKVRAAGGGQLQFRWGAADAAPFATATIPGGSVWDWKEVTVPFTNAPQGTGELFITSADELYVDSFNFTGTGVADVTAPTVTHTLTPAAPTGVGGVYNVPVTVNLNVVENGAIGTVQQSRDGGATWQNITAAQGAYRIAVTTNGTYNIQYRATDSAGNISQVGTASFTIDLSAANVPTVDSTTVATVSASTVTFGTPGSVTVTVSGAGGTPSGQVILTVGDTQVGTGTLAGGTATIALPANLPVGAHTIKASYGADGTFKASSGTVRLNVAKSGSVVDASVSPNPVKAAVAAKVSVHAESTTGVAGAGNITVLVKRGISTAATVTGTLDADGNAVISLPKLTAGSYTITVTHAATANTTAASKTISLTVQN